MAPQSLSRYRTTGGGPAFHAMTPSRGAAPPKGSRGLCRAACPWLLMLPLSAGAVPADENFDAQSDTSVSDAALTVNDWTFRFLYAGGFSDRGFLGVDNDGVSDLGPDQYLIAMGFLGQTDGLAVTSGNGVFRLDGLTLAKGVAGRTAVTVQGLSGGGVVASRDLTLVDGLPGDNPGQAITFSGGQWNSLDAVRILNTDGSGDFDVELDDLAVSTPQALPPNLSIGTLASDRPEGDTGTTAFTFTVTRSGDTSGASSATYSVAGAGADPADAVDFGGVLPGGSVNFSATQTSDTVTVQVSGDTAVENDETFTVTLSNPVGATLGITTAEGTIRNDDANAVPELDLDVSNPLSRDFATHFEGGGAAVAVANGDASLTDPNTGDAIEALTATLVARPDGDAVESLSLDAAAQAAAGAAGLAVVYTPATGVLAIGGSGTPALYQELLRGIVYHNGAPAAAVTDGDRTVNLVANDGSGDSAVVTGTIDVSTSPVVDLNGPGAGIDRVAGFTEGTPLAVAPDATVADPGGDDLEALGIRLTDPVDGAAERIGLAGRSDGDVVDGITVGYGSQTRIDLTGAAPAASYQALLRELTFDDATDDPDTAERHVEVQARDVTGRTGTTAVATVQVTAVNDPPTVAVNAGLTVLEGGDGIIDNTRLNGGDPDDAGTGLNYTVTTSPAHGRLELTTNPGNPITGFSQDAIDGNRVRYVHDGSETTADSFDFSLADGGEDGAAAVAGTFAITVTAQNDPPVIGDLDGDAFDYDGGSGARLLDQATPLTVGDADSADFDGGSLSVSITVNRDDAEDRLSILTGGEVTLSAGMTAGSLVSVGGVPVGSIAAGGDGIGTNDLVVLFDQAAGNATPGRIQTLVRALAYENTDAAAPTENTRTLAVVLADGDGGSSAAVQVMVSVYLDGDSDGIPGATEDAVPNPDGSGSGDGNGDGVPDSRQAHVVSFQTSDAAHWVTLVCTDGYALTGVSSGPAPADAPAGVWFPFGLLGFTVSGVPVGGLASLQVYVDRSRPVSGYMKRNLATGAWDPLATSLAPVGTRIRIGFTLRDGDDYDGDFLADGSVQDPGGPFGPLGAVVPLLDAPGLALLALLLGIFGTWHARRERVGGD